MPTLSASASVSRVRRASSVKPKRVDACRWRKSEGHHGGGEDDVVEAEVAVQPGPEEHRPGDVGDARRPAEDVEGPEDRVHHLGEGEHAQAEVDAAELERDHAEEPREDGGHRAPCEEAEPHRHVELRRQERRGVGAERDVAGVAEGQVAHPHDDVERLRVHHVDEHHDGHVEDVGLGERRQRDEGDEDGSKRGGLHAQEPVGETRLERWALVIVLGACRRNAG